MPKAEKAVLASPDGTFSASVRITGLRSEGEAHNATKILLQLLAVYLKQVAGSAQGVTLNTDPTRRH